MRYPDIYLVIGGADHSDILEWHKLYDFAEVNDGGIVTEDDVKARSKNRFQKKKNIISSMM